MKKKLLSKYSLSIVVIIFIGIFPIILSCSRGGGSGPAPAPVSPPYTTAAPVKGIYTAPQSVTLTANRPATIYYSLDGDLPSIGKANTFSGPSPLSNILITQDTNVLQFFARDSEGRLESVRSETYIVTSGTASGPGDEHNYFPLTVGNTWITRLTVTETGSQIYEGTTTITGTKIVRGVTTLISKWEESINFEEEYLYKNSSGLISMGTNDPSDILGAQMVPFPVMIFPPLPGSSFVSINKALDSGEDLDWDGKNEVVDLYFVHTINGFGTATVPAGTFPNCLMQQTSGTLTITLSSTQEKFTSRVTATEWFAPNVGTVKYTSVQTYDEGSEPSMETEELIGSSLAAPFFGPVSTFTAGSSQLYAQFVTAGDVNGDGKPDLAVTTSTGYGNDYVSILLGTGTGTFESTADYLTDSMPNSAAIGDLNGDGKPDLVVTNYGSTTFSLLPGNGDGTFGAATNIPLGNNPTNVNDVRIADFNGDGKPDLALVKSPEISILLSEGSGSFGTAVDYVVGSSPPSLAIGDLNGDGNLDLVAGNESDGNISILLGDGAGAFGTAVDYALNGRPRSVAIEDINGDGKMDIGVALMENHSNIVVLLGDGDGSFSAPTYFTCFVLDSMHGGFLPKSAAIAEFNGDGKPDVVVLDQNRHRTCILLGDGTGSLGAATYFVNVVEGVSPSSLAIGDFNGDGKSDLAVTVQSSTNNLAIILNTSGSVP